MTNETPTDEQAKRKAKYSPKRTKGEIELDREQFATFYIQGWPIRAMARWVGENRSYTLSRQGVLADLKAIRKEWVKTRVGIIDAWMDKELAKLDHMEAGAWAGYERSCRDLKKVKKFGSSGIGGSKTAASEEGWERDGDPKWYQIILNVMDRRAKLLGWDAPTKLKVDATLTGEVKVETADLNDKHIGDLAREFFLKEQAEGTMPVRN